MAACLPSRGLTAWCCAASPRATWTTCMTSTATAMSCGSSPAVSRPRARRSGAGSSRSSSASASGTAGSGSGRPSPGPPPDFLGWFHLRPAGDGGVDLGYRLRKVAWNQGYATEGSRALIRKCFTELGGPGPGAGTTVRSGSIGRRKWVRPDSAAGKRAVSNRFSRRPRPVTQTRGWPGWHPAGAMLAPGDNAEPGRAATRSRPGRVAGTGVRPSPEH